jgi:hypothetical protein
MKKSDEYKNFQNKETNQKLNNNSNLNNSTVKNIVKLKFALDPQLMD